MDDLKIARNVQIGNKVKSLINLFEPHTKLSVSYVNVSATNNQSKVRDKPSTMFF